MGVNGHISKLLCRVGSLVLISCVALVNPGCKQRDESQRHVVQSSGLDSLARSRWSSVKEFGDVFEEVQTVQLSTGPEYLIGRVTAFCVLGNGDLLVADGMMARSVLLFSGSGTFLRTIGSQGEGPGEYLYPEVVAVAGDSLIYVYDGDLLRLAVFSVRGEYRRSLQIGRYHNQLVVDLNGNLFFYSSSISDASGATGATVFKYSSVGKLLVRFAPQSQNFVPSGPSAGGGIAIDQRGMIYHITPYEYRISQYTGDGKLVNTFSRDAPFYKAPPRTTANLQKDRVALSRWHGSWTHIMGLTLIHGNILIVVMQDLPTRRDLLEFYDTAGNFLAGEIELPPRTSITFASHNDYLYLVEHPEEPSITGHLPNPRVIRYRLRPSLKS